MHTTVFHDLRLVEFADMEPWIQMVYGQVICGFSTVQGSVHLTLCCSRINCNCSIPKSNPEVLNLFVDEERGNKPVSVVINSN